MTASAGSGKTYSLVLKYIRLLLCNRDRYTYRRILAVTFTNKATDEMKARILMELHHLATSPEDSPYRLEFIPSIFPDDESMNREFWLAVSWASMSAEGVRITLHRALFTS